MKALLKKFFADLLITSLLLPLVLALTSCGEGFLLNRMEEDQRAVEFMNILNRNMSRHANYTVVTENELALETNGVGININETTTSIVVYDEKSEEYFEHNETHSIINEGEKKNEITIIKGFADGKMFSSYNMNAQKPIKLWSPVTAEEHLAHEAEMSGAKEVDDNDMVETAATRTCVKNSDKTWTATYTDYTEEGLNYFRDAMGNVEDVLAYANLTDVMMTIHATEALYPTTMEMIFEYELSEDAEAGAKIPTFIVRTTYQDIGTTQALEMDFTEYKEVVDLRVGDIIEKSLQDFIGADQAEFKINMFQRATYKGQTEGYSESNEGRFEMTSAGYSFDIQSEIQDEKYILRYCDGVRRVMNEKEEEIEQETITDAEAKAFISALLNPASFNSTQVMDVTKDEILSKNGKDVYHLTLQTPELDTYEESLGVIFLSGECTLKVSLEAGRMTQQTFTLTMISDEGLEFSITYKCYYYSFSNADDMFSDM